MTIQDIGAIGEFLGSIVIVVTLIYLAIQNKYQQKLLLSQSYQARNDSALTVIGWMFNSDIAATFAKNSRDEGLTDVERIKWSGYQIGSYRSFENSYYQYELGILGVEHLRAIREMIRRAAHGHQWRDWWQDNKTVYRSSFIEWVDEIIKESEQEQAHHVD